MRITCAARQLALSFDSRRDVHCKCQIRGGHNIAFVSRPHSARGLTIYLTLPQRYMDTHFRWLRLMVTLTLGEMERIKGRPKTGHPTLFLLDEFPGLKRMEVIENAVAQAAGFGVLDERTGAALFWTYTKPVLHRLAVRIDQADTESS